MEIERIGVGKKMERFSGSGVELTVSPQTVAQTEELAVLAIFHKNRYYATICLLARSPILAGQATTTSLHPSPPSFILEKISSDLLRKALALSLCLSRQQVQRRLNDFYEHPQIYMI